MKTTWPRFGNDEIRAVARVLRSGKVNQWTGEEVSAFEEEFRTFVGADYAVAYANGSLALEAAFSCLPEKEVTIPARTFVATAMAAVRAGKRVRFMDVGDDGLSIGPVTCTVHLGGSVSTVRCAIEDCAQAMGATHNGQHVGTFGKMGVFSFCQDKIMTTGGEGGMVVTNDYMTYRKLWSWKDHGKSYELSHSKSQGQYIWCHTGIGTNARMTEMQAAIGRVQLKKVPEWVRRRRALADRLWERLKNVRGIRTTPVGIGDACYRFYAYLALPLQDHWSYHKILSELQKRDVDCGQGVCPEVYREQAFYTGLIRCPNAFLLGSSSIMFKLDPTMDGKYIDHAAAQLREVMKKACLRSA